MLLELLPLGVRGIPVFGGRAQGSPFGDERAVGADQVLLEDLEIGLGCVEVCVTQQPGRDVERQTAGDGLGDEHPPEVVRGVAERLAGGIRETGEAEDVVEIPLNETLVGVPVQVQSQVRLEVQTLGMSAQPPVIDHLADHRISRGVPDDNRA